jgi:hypothetical protein
MRFVRALAVAGLMLAGAPSGFADKVSSSALRFSADFPGAVQQGAPEDNATDENDRVISRVTPFEDAVAGRYLALVMVDTYITPYPIEASVYLKHNIQGFIDGIKGTATQKETTFEGHPAIQFSFDTPDHIMQGQGWLVFVPGEKPVGYMMAAGRMPDATAEDKAKLDAFYTSFDIK